MGAVEIGTKGDVSRPRLIEVAEDEDVRVKGVRFSDFGEPLEVIGCAAPQVGALLGK